MSISIQLSEFVVDTIALVLYLEKRKMGSSASGVFEGVEAGTVNVIVPAMVFAEILYLSERGRIAVGLAEVDGFFNRFPLCKEQPLTLGVVQAASEIIDVPELHDRLIAGTARHLGLDLVTNDGKIQKSAYVTTIW
jgi:predicted nucleic acid-binding protein